MENVSASKPNHTFSILEFLLADGARPVVTIINHRSFVLRDGACCVGRWTGVVRVRILRVQRIELPRSTSENGPSNPRSRSRWVDVEVARNTALLRDHD